MRSSLLAWNHVGHILCVQVVLYSQFASDDATLTHGRLLRHALELKKPVLLLNTGPTRADGLVGVEKLEISSNAVMRDAVRAVL